MKRIYLCVTGCTGYRCTAGGDTILPRIHRCPNGRKADWVRLRGAAEAEAWERVEAMMEEYERQESE